ncbi:MAG: hypothetical protein UR60_C0022G0021 [Candidatus Moranbacteria bacterium GW2011_GWF2_34_56]|nr:MAG: hypothetical protein UR51_C0018G0020 [Candidatus Moranbacteria bacterium GW2011_GWF1_34_10]KKP64391.1 MAG: hypothetical protein UR60_C0022G0021 [Candidatus Moranbacteria bacterium GW2011_GWF2_34_56]HBI16981.1 hypothetical protein [Candidatus Moranbacteria bacterium]
MKKISKNNYLAILAIIFCFFVNIQHVKAVTVTEATAAKTCTWNWIRNICATSGPTDPYPTFETSGGCPSGSYWHSDKVQDSCTGERRCGNSGIWTGKTYTIPATYNCTYISGANYGGCTGNYSAAYKYVSSYNYSTVSGSSCSDGSYGPVACKEDGACGSRSQVFNSNVTNWPTTEWCSVGTPSFPNGTPLTFPGQGEVTVNWSCLGIGASHVDATNCHTGRKLANPSVDLKIDIGNGPSNGPVLPNRDNGDNLDMYWVVTPNASGVTTYCDKSGNSWGGGQIVPLKGLIDSDNDVPLPSGTYPINNSSYSLTCHNSNGNGEVNSNSVVDSVLVSVYCNDTPPAYNTCSKECGTGWQTCSDKNNRCVESICPGRNCNTEPCPITSEWREVKP